MAATHPIIGRILGHYRVLEQIGAGGMGVVFRAYDQRLERDVALKVLPASTVLDEAARQRFRAEALALSKLNHPHIAQIYDFDTYDGIDFLVMEFVKGIPLDQKLLRGTLAEEEIIRLGTQIASTLEEVSAMGMVHRDLKPSNIVIAKGGEVKLLDFGVAKLLSSEDRTHSSALEITGTLPYMSPEQLKGEPTDFRSDIYQVGATLYQAATGSRPFTGIVPGPLIQEILQKTPIAPRHLNPHLDPALEAIILRCLAKEPARRYQRASELRVALETLETSSGLHLANLPTQRRRHGRRWILELTLIVVALMAAVIWKQTRKPAKDAPRVNELAILPLPSAGDPELSAFSRGLVHTLSSRLSQLTATHALQVVPPSDIAEKRITTLDQARQEFGANLGLELDVERSGERARVNYALVNTVAHRQMSGDTITASWSDPFGLEDQVAESVLRSLQLELRPEERKLLTDYGTREPAAYDFYLRGWGYLQDFLKPENVENAIHQFRSALDIDPNYSLAFAGLGEAFWRKYELTKEPEWVRQARTNCDRSLQLDPNQAAPYLCLGIVNAGTGAYEKAAGDYKLATELEPTNDAAFKGLADVYQDLGQPQKAESTFRKAISLRPNYWATYNSLGSFYLRLGRYKEASEMFSKVIELAPDSFAGYSNVGACYFAQGDYLRAIPAFERSVQIRPTADATSNLGTAYFQVQQFAKAARIFEAASSLDAGSYEVWGNLGDAYYWAPGEREKSRGAYEKAISLALKQSEVNPRDGTLLSYLAQYYAMDGQRSQALNYIHRSLRAGRSTPDMLATAALVFNQCGDVNQAVTYLQRAVAAGYSKDVLRDTPNFDNLRSLPTFQKLMGS